MIEYGFITHENINDWTQLSPATRKVDSDNNCDEKPVVYLQPSDLRIVLEFALDVIEALFEDTINSTVQNSPVFRPGSDDKRPVSSISWFEDSKLRIKLSTAWIVHYYYKETEITSVSDARYIGLAAILFSGKV